MASLAALMNAYTLQPGDIIHVGAGTYALPTSVVLTAADSGRREILSRLSGQGAATIFSGDVAATSPIFEFDGGHDITLENMTLRGGTIGVDVVDNSGSVDVTLQGLEISGFVGAAGVYVGAGSSGFALTGSTIDDPASGNSNGAGVDLVAATNATVTVQHFAKSLLRNRGVKPGYAICQQEYRLQGRNERRRKRQLSLW